MGSLTKALGSIRVRIILYGLYGAMVTFDIKPYSTFLVEDLMDNLKDLLNKPKRRQLYRAIRLDTVLHRCYCTVNLLWSTQY